MSRRDFFNFFTLRVPQGKSDAVFLWTFFCIILFGLLMLSSASAVISFQKFNSAYYYLIHQILFGFLPGLVLFFVCSRIPYRIWRNLAFAFLLGSIGLLILVFVPGIGYSYGGAHRWIHLGGLVFQPSEIAKLTFLLYLATWLSNRGEKHLQNFSYGFLPFLALVGVVAFLVIAQPDMGTMGIIVLIAFSMMFVGGASMKHLVFSVIGGVGILAALTAAAPYRLHRLLTFLDPQMDKLGIGYHVNQALLAVGSGGIFGRGFGHSRQKFAYLPEVTGDSIFAIIAEELGLILSLLLIATLVFFAIRGLRIAAHCPDQFGKLVVVGVISWVIFQSFINIAAMLAVLPLTGVPLPFVSYGGTSLVILMAAMGIVANVSRHSEK